MCPPSSSEFKHVLSANPLIDQLVRALASVAPGKLPATETDGKVEEILADVVIDGFRYLLVRLPKPAAASTQVSLSPREREIVRMVAQGHPNKVIAGVLNISGWTVCTHLRRIFAKLNVGSRAAMVARLLEVGAVGDRFCAMQDAHAGAAGQLTTEARETASPKLQTRAARR